MLAITCKYGCLRENKTGVGETFTSSSSTDIHCVLYVFMWRNVDMSTPKVQSKVTVCFISYAVYYMFALSL